MQTRHNSQDLSIIKATNPIPFGLWATQTNKLFYNNVINPLGCFRTLGSADPLLPKAFSAYLNNAGAQSVHEIGSGNFFFAKSIIEQVPAIRDYHTYDFSKASYDYLGDSLPSKIKFHNSPANQVRGQVQEGNTHIVGVELCDDLPNEFWSFYEGTPVDLWMDFGVDSRLDMPPHAALSVYQGQNLELLGDELRKELKDKRFDAINAKQLCDLIAQGDWVKLQKYNPGILKALHYLDRQFMPYSLERVFKFAWSTMPDDFHQIGESILQVYRQQLSQIKQFGEVVHLPTAAIALLWQFKDLPKSALHFFDYGYDSIENLPGPYSVYEGQVTTPVNFGLLKFAAEQMGYKVRLQKDKEFIQEQTGEDALTIARIQGFGIEQQNPEVQAILQLHLYAEAASELNPNIEINSSNISGLRVRRTDVESISAMLDRPYSYRDGSFYFRAEI